MAESLIQKELAMYTNKNIFRILVRIFYGIISIISATLIFRILVAIYLGKRDYSLMEIVGGILFFGVCFIYSLFIALIKREDSENNKSIITEISSFAFGIAIFLLILDVNTPLFIKIVAIIGSVFFVGGAIKLHFKK